MVDKEGVNKALPEGWTVWDSIDIKGSKTCQEFIDYMKEKYGVTVNSINANAGTIQLYADFIGNTRKNLPLKVEDAYEKISKNKIKSNSTFLILDITGNFEKTTIGGKTYENIMASIAKIKYIFK
jgi:hypothetical protein